MSWQALLLLCFCQALLVDAHYGQATWYYPGIGACGWININSDHIVALSTTDYAGGSHCGKMIKVSYQGKSVDVRVVDLCPGCQGTHGIDLSPGAFQTLSTLPIGIIPVEWNFI